MVDVRITLAWEKDGHRGGVLKELSVRNIFFWPAGLVLIGFLGKNCTTYHRKVGKGTFCKSL